ncbi:DUF2304 domain-containing protein [Virgibacillus sp. MSP4-1]|uniref:DUF2304 domain-containing protein n=1 Tax=Virgibacillus sp. MSP4-1 TaxID=2700081 RepID=UPI00039A1FDA|nr:DUF2304 domain-containing protein [Virgibacillus sp. MSP4-1]QHS23506.1 DUF2304 domain-containing protein [Virgibacillus sp. MSP4-1]
MDVTMVALLVVISIFIFVFESVRRGILETKYSILWFITCITLAILSIFESIITIVADFLKVGYAPSILFLFGLLFSLILLFDMTRRISKLHRQLDTLTQEYSLLQQKIQSEHNQQSN